MEQNHSDRWVVCLMHSFLGILYLVELQNIFCIKHIRQMCMQLISNFGRGDDGFSSFQKDPPQSSNSNNNKLNQPQL